MSEENTLVCPFLDGNPVFANGVEFGMLYSRMKEESEIDGYFHTVNQEQITLLANRLGWQILKLRKWKLGPEWTRIHMRRREDVPC